ncbi:MAG TPA: UDP-N-acetylglucosamine--N-acetylmuramyl-(pentapeptide) pyrophosphoryl-undecaprenol N-acetylglucosamine transferase, partial [Ignavibacteria bacterium]|nr:UDP-N-acetylglucosamine--N-acetylmuramyl-(pentapeptide) pyrophosphoryl-undecaprenol N-acetylglucosamine transferase [Ignavibacteria bacterium]
MKVLFTGGGTGGHFYPIIAIAQELNKRIEKEHFPELRLYFMSDNVYDERLLFENGIAFIKVKTGKVRKYFSILNILDVFKIPIAAIHALVRILFLFPDVV